MMLLFALLLFAVSERGFCSESMFLNQKPMSNFTSAVLPVGQRLQFLLNPPFKIDAFRVIIDTFANVTDFDRIKDLTLSNFTFEGKYPNVPDFCFYDPIYPHITPILKINENPFLRTEFIVSKDDYIFLLDENSTLLGSKLKSLDPPVPVPPLFSKVPEITEPPENFFPSNLGEFSKTVISSDMNLKNESIPSKLFYDKEKGRLQVKVMRKLFYVDISTPSKPVKIAEIPLDFNESSFIGFYNDCLYITGYNADIEIHCVNKDFAISLARTLRMKEAFSALTNETFTPVIMDIQISDNCLMILERDFGLVFVNITDPVNPKYCGNIPTYNGLFVRRQHESVVIIKSQVLDKAGRSSKSPVDLMLQEYQMGQHEMELSFSFVREISLGTRPIKSVEMTTNYVVMIRANSLTLYLHSVPTVYMNLDDDILSEYMLEDFLTIQSARVDLDNNILLLGFWPNNFYLMNIQVRSIPIVCRMEKYHEGKNYMVQISVLGKDCLEDTLLRQEKKFDDICIYKTGFFAKSNVTEQRGLLASFDDDEKRKLGLGLGLFFGLFTIIVIIFILNWRRLKAKYQELRMKKEQYGRIVEEDKKKKVDLSVSQLKDASTVI